MSLKFKIEKFVEEFGFYIFILFSTFIISFFKSFYSTQISLRKFYGRVLVLEELFQEKLNEIISGKVSGFENIPVLIFSFIVTIIIFFSLYLFLFQIYKKLRARPLIEEGGLSPSPLWNLKDFFKIVIWILFWIQIFSIAEGCYEFINKSFSEEQSLYASLFGSMLFDLSIFILLIYWLKKYYKQRLTSLGIYRNRVVLDFKIALISYLSFLPLLFFLIYLSGIYFQKYQKAYEPQPIFYFLLFEKKPLFLGIAILFIVFLGPIVEEIFFRGLFYNSLKKSIGATQAMLASSLLFSLLHMNLLGFLPILGLALVFVYLYEKTGSLLIPIFIHILHNGFLVFLIFGLRVFLKI